MYRVAFRKWMMGGQNVELSVVRLNVCTVLHVKPEKFGGARGYKGGGECPPAPPPLNATLVYIHVHLLVYIHVWYNNGHGFCVCCLLVAFPSSDVHIY